MIFEQVLRIAPPGTIIPKPEAKGSFVVKGLGKRRGDRAIVYTIANHRRPEKPYEKGVSASELEVAYKQLVQAGSLTRQWFKEHLPQCDGEGDCNFTTVGGLFVLLGRARYADRGVYQVV